MRSPWQSFLASYQGKASGTITLLHTLEPL